MNRRKRSNEFLIAAIFCPTKLKIYVIKLEKLNVLFIKKASPNWEAFTIYKQNCSSLLY